jgi:hypothetical protein
MIAPVPERWPLTPFLRHGLGFVERSQLPTGEIPSYFRIAGGELLYCLSPFASTLAHDALGCLDPGSPRYERGAVALLSGPAGLRLSAMALQVRRRVRDFVAWQEGADGRFGFFGRGSGLAPDAATTSCAAAVLLEDELGNRGRHLARPSRPAQDAPEAGRWRRHAEALERHRSADGRYFTYVDDEGRGWGALGPIGERLPGFDRVVNAHVLRFLALAGEPAGELAAWLLDEARAGDFSAGSPDHPDPLVFLHAVARAFGQAGLPGLGELAAALVPRLLALQQADGGFGNALGTSMAIHALLDLGAEDEEPLASAAAALLRLVAPNGAWTSEAYVRQGGGSASLSTALAVSALARLIGVLGTEVPV